MTYGGERLTLAVPNPARDLWALSTVKRRRSYQSYGLNLVGGGGGGGGAQTQQGETGSSVFGISIRVPVVSSYQCHSYPFSSESKQRGSEGREGGGASFASALVKIGYRFFMHRREINKSVSDCSFHGDARDPGHFPRVPYRLI